MSQSTRSQIIHGIAWALVFVSTIYICGYLVFEAVQMVVAP